MAKGFNPCSDRWLDLLSVAPSSPARVVNGQLVCLGLVGIPDLVGHDENYWFISYFVTPKKSFFPVNFNLILDAVCELVVLFRSGGVDSPNRLG